MGGGTFKLIQPCRMELLRVPAVLQARADALPGRVRVPRRRGAAPRLDAYRTGVQFNTLF